MWKVREIADKVTNVVMNYTEIESKVREATNDEPWGPTGTIKHELSQATYSYDQFPEVMGMLWKRIAENKRSPRRIYKSLLLLHHLLLHGSDRVVRAAQDRLYEIRSLQDYHVIYDPGFNLDAIIPPSGTETKDGEANVRVKAKELVDLVQDEERLREERKKARKNRDKYVGIGSDRMMTSKWTDNDYSGGYDDEYGKKSSRSPSPPSKSKFKPFSDSESEFKRGSNTNSFNSNRSNSKMNPAPAPPSPGIEITDDFDPRAAEKSSDFGDFASAATKTTPSSASGATDSGGDFADFQSAFSVGDSASSLTNANSKSEPGSGSKGEDLLGLSFESPKPSTNNASILSHDLFPTAAPIQQQSSLFSAPNASPFPAFGQTITPPVVQSPTGQMGSAFQTVGDDFSSFSMAPASVQQQQPQSLPVMRSLSPSTNPPLAFDGIDLFSSVLQPTMSPSASNGSIANNSVSNNNNNNNPKPSLQGTTWSDLNISIDDLNLGRNTKNAAGSKTSMNQLRATNTTNNFSGFP